MEICIVILRPEISWVAHQLSMYLIKLSLQFLDSGNHFTKKTSSNWQTHDSKSKKKWIVEKTYFFTRHCHSVSHHFLLSRLQLNPLSLSLSLSPSFLSSLSLSNAAVQRPNVWKAATLTADLPVLFKRAVKITQLSVRPSFFKSLSSLLHLLLFLLLSLSHFFVFFEK